MTSTDPAAPYLIDYVEARPGGRIGMRLCPDTARFPSARESWQRAIGDNFDAIAACGAAAVVTLVPAAELARLALADLRRAPRHGVVPPVHPGRRRADGWVKCLSL